MKIGIITLSRTESKQNQFYNAQDMGLAGALRRMGHEVSVYRLTKDTEQETEADGVRVISRKARGFGRQSLCRFNFLDEGLDRLICFSDNQVSYPALYKWCGKHNIILLPYIGVIRSNSPRRLVQALTDTLVERNLKLYRRQRVFGKTPDLLRQLKERGCRDAALAPVCLDPGRLYVKYAETDKRRLREELGFGEEDKILLFIGRLEPEKEPLDMLEILSRLLRGDSSYRLVLIGRGSLEGELKNRIDRESALKDRVFLLREMPNREIWKYYCISDCFVNLNRHEIYGMSILEALFYDCPVIAWSAPGPEFILNHGEAGRLCASLEAVEQSAARLCGGKTVKTHEYLLKRLSWDETCKAFISL